MKKLLAILLAVAMLLTLTACSTDTQTGDQTAAQPAEESKGFTPALDTQAELSLNVVGSYGNFEALEQVIQDFQVYYPNVTVTYEQISDFDSAFPMRCAGGDNLDLFFTTATNYDRLYNGAITGYAVDLSTIGGMDLSAVDEDALLAGQQNGKQLLLPVFYQTNGLIVNETLLAKYGLTVPTTIDELASVCDALLEKGITPLYGVPVMQGRLFLASVVSTIVNADNSAGLCAALEQGTLDTALLETACDTWREWTEKGYFNPEAETLKDSYNAAILRFFEGDVPFLIGTSDTISGCKKREAKSEAFTAAPFDYSYIVPAMGQDDPSVLLIANSFFGVYKGSEHVDYAGEFIRFLATREELVTMAAVKGMPAVVANAGDSRFTRLEALPDTQKRYTSRLPFSINAFSCLSGAMVDVASPDAAAIAALFTEKMAE